MVDPYDIDDPEWERELALLDATQRRAALGAALKAWDHATQNLAGERLDLMVRLELLAQALAEYEDDLEAGSRLPPPAQLRVNRCPPRS